jgi:hypothetical protein
MSPIKILFLSKDSKGEKTLLSEFFLRRRKSIPAISGKDKNLSFKTPNKTASEVKKTMPKTKERRLFSSGPSSLFPKRNLPGRKRIKTVRGKKNSNFIKVKASD